MYKGVTETTGGYIATINGVTTIGRYSTEVEAALVHDLAVLATLGEFATERNFPDLTEDELVAALDNDLTLR